MMGLFYRKGGGGGVCWFSGFFTFLDVGRVIGMRLIGKISQEMLVTGLYRISSGIRLTKLGIYLLAHMNIEALLYFYEFPNSYSGILVVL